MKSYRASLLSCGAIPVLALALGATSASASVDEYSVYGNSSVRVELEVCSAESQLAVTGDGGTDLDFVVTDQSGAAVHSDDGVDDYLSVVLEKAGNDCQTFGLAVSNLGEEPNAFTVLLEPIIESSVRVQKYIIQPNQTRTINFKACGTSAELTARGDGDTDLDFIVRNADGGVVHENDDTTDETSATLVGLLSDCETFEMDVANLGAVYNALMVVIEPEGADNTPFAGTAPSTSLASATGSPGMRTSVQAERSGAGNYRADANTRVNIDLPICGATRMQVRGDGDTDLDFTVRNPAGTTVHSDFDLTDVTFATLETIGDACETFSIQVDNIGDVYNDFTITLTSADERLSVAGPGEYRVNANGSTKIALQVCEATRVTARGDGDTDLDFTITNALGTTVHSDFDLTDRTAFDIEPSRDCEIFQMAVSNLGDVYNVLTVAFGDDVPEEETREEARDDAREGKPPPPPIVIAPAPPPIETVPVPPSERREGPPALVIPPPAPPPVSPPPARGQKEGGAPLTTFTGPGEYRVDANATVTVALNACGMVQLDVAGDGDTDLDFFVTDQSGDFVHSDYDFDDDTTALLRPPASTCVNYTLEVSNLGDVYNVFTVEMAEVSTANAAAKSAAEGGG